MDAFLRQRMVGLLFADVDALGVGGGESQQRFARQVIEENDVSRFQNAAAFEREQLGIARPRADEVDIAGLNLRNAGRLQ